MSQLDNFLDVAEFVLHDHSSATSDVVGRYQPFLSVFSRGQAFTSSRPFTFNETIEERNALSDDSQEERFGMGSVPLSPERTFIMDDWQLHPEQTGQKDSVTSTVLCQNNLTDTLPGDSQELHQYDGADSLHPRMLTSLENGPPINTEVIISFNKHQTNNISIQKVELEPPSQRPSRGKRINNRGNQSKQKMSLKTTGRLVLKPMLTQQSQERPRMRGRPKAIKKYNTAIKRRGRKPNVNNEDITIMKSGRPTVRKPQTEVKPPQPVQTMEIRYIYKRKVGRPRKNEILIERLNQSK